MSHESIDLLNRYQSGDDGAAEELFDRYVRRLVALAGSRLSNAMKRRVAAEDIVQSVYSSFFRRADDNQFNIEAPGQLWGLLAAITINKVRDKAKFHNAQKRAMNAEQSINASRSCYGLVPTNFANEPTIDDAAALEEVLKLTLEDLPEQQREIFELYLQNLTTEEIAKEVRRSARTVRRTIESIRSSLESRLGIG